MKLKTSLIAAAGIFVAVDLSFSAGLLGGFQIDLPHSFTPGTPARANEVNENFETITAAVEMRAIEVDDRFASIGELENVITVSTARGQFSSVAAALASINDASANHRYVVQVGPGVYEETELSLIPSFVTLRGAGPAATIVRSSRNLGGPLEGASTVQMQDLSAIEDICIENAGSSELSIAIYAEGLTRDSRMFNVVATATGQGGVQHIAVRVDDSDVTIVDSVLRASGATGGNSALSSVGLIAVSQIFVRSSDLEGAGIMTGVAASGSRTAFHIENSRIQGDLNAVRVNSGSTSVIRGSRAATTGLNPIYSQSGSAIVVSANSQLVGGDPLGSPSQFKYVHCENGNFDPIVNGTGSSVN